MNMAELYQYNQSLIDSATRLKEGHRNSLFNWFSAQPEGVRVDALRLMRKNLGKYKSKLNNETYAEILYSSLIVALNKMRIIETTKAHKRGMDSEQGRKITQIKIARIIEERKRSRNAKKRDFISQLFAEIDQLRKEGLSWREIEKYFLRNHRKKISYAYIQQEFNRIKNCRMKL
ncbi:Lipopolysaccharide core biosynthesis [Candidatus Magnetomorum sp. HK-1]|nr:Lipopolysaccharide core biosynthesis [Candidatus Magnetomorum sp. HK-1]